MSSPREHRDPDCLFCKIVAGEIPSNPAGESVGSYAFHDVSPKAPTHVLVVPRRHIENAHAVAATDGDALADMVLLAQQVADAAGISEGGYRLVLNVGDDAGNSVPHLHLHLLGGRLMAWPPG